MNHFSQRLDLALDKAFDESIILEQEDTEKVEPHVEDILDQVKSKVTYQVQQEASIITPDNIEEYTNKKKELVEKFLNRLVPILKKGVKSGGAVAQVSATFLGRLAKIAVKLLMKVFKPLIDQLVNSLIAGFEEATNIPNNFKDLCEKGLAYGVIAGICGLMATAIFNQGAVGVLAGVIGLSIVRGCGIFLLTLTGINDPGLHESVIWDGLISESGGLSDDLGAIALEFKW